MVVGFGPGVLDIADGEEVVLDGMVVCSCDFRHPEPRVEGAQVVRGPAARRSTQLSIANDPSMRRRPPVRIPRHAASVAEVHEALAAGSRGWSVCCEQSSSSSTPRPGVRGSADQISQADFSSSLRDDRDVAARFRRRQDAAVLRGATERGVELLLQAPHACELSCRQSSKPAA